MSISIPQHHFTKLHKSKPCLASTAHAQNIYGSDPWSPVSRPPLNDRQRALSEALRAIGKSAAQQKYTDHMQILTPRPQLAVPFINSHVSHSTSQSSDTTGQSSNGGGAQAEKGSGSWGGNDDLGRNLERNGDSDLSNSTAWKPETGGFKCPVREKAKKNKMQHKDCMINFTSEEDARKHAEEHHFACPMCKYDPCLSRKRTKSIRFTKGKTLKDIYFGECTGLREHVIMTHLRWIPCKYGCGSGFFTEQASKIHLKICSMASSARNHTEQPIPTELKELIRDVKACCSPRKSNTAADIATALYPLLLSSDGKKKFDALDEINLLFEVLPRYVEDDERNLETSEEGETEIISRQGDNELTFRISTMFTSAFNKVDDKERFMLQFLEYQSKESRDILCSLSRSEPTRKRDLSPPDQRSGHKRKRTSDDNDGARKIQSFGSFEFLGTHLGSAGELCETGNIALPAQSVERTYFENGGVEVDQHKRLESQPVRQQGAIPYTQGNSHSTPMSDIDHQAQMAEIAWHSQFDFPMDLDPNHFFEY